MAQIFDIPQINPLKFYQQSDIFGTTAYTQSAYGSFNPNINDRGIDSDFFYRNLKDWMSKRTYYQPYQQGDTLALQFVGIDDQAGPTVSYVIRILDMYGVMVKEVDTTSTAVGSDFIREVVSSLYDIPDGKYFVQIHKVGLFTDYDFWVISEGIDVKAKHLNTVLIEYSNTSNDQGIFWETNVVMQLRIHAYLKLGVNSVFNVYEDQPLNLQMLSGVPFREWEFIVGTDGKPFPPYMLDKLNRVLLCDTLRIDGILYTLIEGAKFEVQQPDRYPLITASITLREKENNQDIVIQNIPPVVLGMAPSSEWFYILEITQVTGPATYTVNKYFNGAVNFVNWLNSDDMFDIVDGKNTFFAIDSQNQIVLITNSDAIYALYPDLLFSDPYEGHAIVEIDTALGTDLIVDYVNSILTTNYIYFWGDGTNNFGSATSASETHTYTANEKFKAYLFWDLAQNIDLSGSDQILKTIGGKLPKRTLTFFAENNIVEKINNNMFDNSMVSGVGFITGIGLSGNKIPTNNVNEIIMYMYESMLAGSLDNSGGMDTQSQTPPAPPTSDKGIAFFKSQLVSFGFAVTTD